MIPMINVQAAPAAVVNTVGPFERPCDSEFGRDSTDCAQISPLFDLLGEDSWLNVHAGELEVRPPGAPTIAAGWRGAPRREGRLATTAHRTFI